MSFRLHPILKKDCIELGQLELCRVLLMNDSQFPWLILVPERENMTEIHQLTTNDQQLLIRESSYIAEKLALQFQADKMNIAALGNMVPQLHIHHVVRYKTDKAWPAPIWGKFDAVAYTDKELEVTLDMLKEFINSREY
ncbi:MAG: HIT domain-containing protein [Gammaproteobacteria bacterium]|jgi:diadenosine tetraphosphate (Ap4A) HIT family hydrolase|nr:HIT domain-containing protein [Gammaproteobacteria bacterium]MBT5223457.1 HIT domain-containing protein [Gammaproteobacteria bacterium]MBT5826860.1 HIT domain-containing protein [Gammaproteobacteria bacterium]MBT5966361.1 HIT domain-containing protein [Gammaproteobacteria bacterium]MBT6420461.1 HIT domain-containing protein [Gammaproteobacteria bacterium]